MALRHALELLRKVVATHLADRITLALARQAEDGDTDKHVVVPQGLFLEECFLRHLGFEDIAALFVAATAAYPTHTWSWMQTATSPLVHGTKQFTPEYAKGAVLGCFQSSVWLNNNWKAETELDDLLPVLIPELILSQHLSRIGLDEHGQERFGGQLAEPVKGWVFGPEYRQPSQFARVHKMLCRLDETVRGGREPNPIGQIVLSKICYVVFGTLAPKAQTHTLSLFLHELLDPIAERVEWVRKGETSAEHSG